MHDVNSQIIGNNLEALRERIRRACERSRRNPDSVNLVAVTKYHDADITDAAVEAGITDIGENRAQKALPKLLEMKSKPRCHFIGPLQTNKVKEVLEHFEVIHSLDRLKLAHEIDRRCKATEIAALACFLQVNVSNEASKGGFEPNHVRDAIEEIDAQCSSIKLVGLMTMAPFNENPENARPHFRRLAEVRDELIKDYPSIVGLSMGMSGDFEVAIEEGATHIRVGSALFEGIEES